MVYCVPKGISKIDQYCIKSLISANFKGQHVAYFLVPGATW